MYFACSVIPTIKANFGFNEEVSIRDDVSLPKVLMAKACDKNEENCLDNVILFAGIFDQGTENSASRLLEKLNQADKFSHNVCFWSPGGSIDSAVRIGNWIKSNNLNTCLAEKYIIEGRGTLSGTHCNSACPFVFLMGDTRTRLGDDLKLVVHHSGGKIDLCFACWKFNSLNSTAYDDYSEMLLSSEHIDKEQHIELLKYSLKTHFSDGKALTKDDWRSYSIFTN
ncbi:hypothetical protein AB733_24270 [Photobacterium swingsii]|nr:hypothetical protein AB733_24270 [Photobacterium swingsii]